MHTFDSSEQIRHSTRTTEDDLLSTPTVIRTRANTVSDQTTLSRQAKNVRDGSLTVCSDYSRC
jgi:hypothetical protein